MKITRGGVVDELLLPLAGVSILCMVVWGIMLLADLLNRLPRILEVFSR